MKTGIELIAAERQEQIEKHGRTLQHDIHENKEEQLCGTAVFCLTKNVDYYPFNWSGELYDKIRDKPYKDRLIISGALIAAEIDRLNNIS